MLTEVRAGRPGKSSGGKIFLLEAPGGKMPGLLTGGAEQVIS